MAKKKSSNSLPVGTRVRIKEGVCVPGFPGVSCGGWSGTVNELTGKKSDPQYVIEWDSQTLAALPEDYVRECEEKMFLHNLACFGRTDLEPLGE